MNDRDDRDSRSASDAPPAPLTSASTVGFQAFNAALGTLVHDPATAALLGVATGMAQAFGERVVIPKARSFFRTLRGDRTEEDATSRIQRNPEAALQAMRRLLDTDIAAVAALAALVDDYLGDPPKRVDGFFRGAAALFSELSADRVGTLRLLLTFMRPLADQGEPVWFNWRTTPRDPVHPLRQAQCFTMPRTGNPSPVPAGALLDVPQVASALVAHGLAVERPELRGAFFSSTTDTPDTPHWDRPVAMRPDVVVSLHRYLCRE